MRNLRNETREHIRKAARTLARERAAIKWAEEWGARPRVSLTADLVGMKARRPIFRV